MQELMKNKPVNLIVLVLLLVLAACTTPKDVIIDENKEVKSLVIDETTTLTAKDLWQYKDDAHMLNLSLDASNHMVLTDASMAATYQSVAIETKRFEALVLSWNSNK